MPRKKVRLVALLAPVLAIALAPRAAVGQPSPAPPPAVAAPATTVSAPAPAPSAAPADEARIADAHADRVVLLPTAYTHPRGTLYLSSYEIALLQIGYALSDETQVTLTGVPPIGPDPIVPIDFSVKTAVLREGLVRAAVMGSLSGVLGLENTFLVVGRVGGVVQLCMQESCHSSFTIGANALFLGPIILTMTGLGSIWRLSESFDLLVELDTLMPIGRELGQANGASLGGGFRYRRARWAVDLTFVGPISHKSEPRALPFLAATYRFL